jgi:HEAT repeat protein
LRDEIAAHQGVTPEVDDLLSRLPLFAPVSASQSLDTVASEMSAPTIQHRLRAAADAIRLISDRGNEIGPWIDLLVGGTPLEVDLAVRRLGELGDARAVEPLTRLFGRIEPERAWIIPEALGRIGSERATLFLTQLLTDEIYRVPSLARARAEAARALARYSKSPVAAQALREAYLQDRGRNLAALLGYARIKGPSAIKDLVELNAVQFSRRTSGQASRHERVNWVLRQLRSGAEIPLEIVRDIDE